MAKWINVDERYGEQVEVYSEEDYQELNPTGEFETRYDTDGGLCIVEKRDGGDVEIVAVEPGSDRLRS